MPAPVLSIITVCFNAGEELRRTVESVLPQTWRQFEYLVVDGDSADGTKPYLETCRETFSSAGLPFRYLCEPDRGIYDAMNKGTRMTRGAWLLFLNAGDLLADSSVLEQFFSERTDAQILYGDALCTYQGRRKLYPALPLPQLVHDMAFCHQSAFIRRELLLAQPYDIRYRTGADHHFFLSMYLQQKSFAYRPVPVCIYEISGYSDTHKLAAHRELHRMQKELGVFRFSAGWLLRECRFYLVQGIKAVFGQRLTDFVRRRRLR